jgi:hypothetical protein
MIERVRFHRAALALVSLVGCTTGNVTQREFLDSLWEKYMLDGTFVMVSIEKDKSFVTTGHSPESVDPLEEEITFPTLMSHPISVMKLGEGVFGNGGWALDGAPASGEGE